MTKPLSFPVLLATAHQLADLAAIEITPYFRKRISIKDKSDGAAFDPVTAADRQAERAIRRHLAAMHPDHGVFGEEFANNDLAARYRWVIDPIDGTRSFIMGLPTWGTLIGLTDGGKPLIGVMDQPYTGERFWTGPRSSYLTERTGKSRRLRTRPCPKLGQAVFSTTHPDLFDSPRERAVHDALKQATRMTRYGGDCYAYCLLASGLVDVIAEPGLKAFDIAALIPIVERAGGRVSTWTGEPATHGGDVLACGDPRLHDEILARIAKL